MGGTNWFSLHFCLGVEGLESIRSLYNFFFFFFIS
jgi:hypothetical protein